MVFIFAVSNHHTGTYDSWQAQGPGTMPQETRAPLPVVPTWSQTHYHTHTHTHAGTHKHEHPLGRWRSEPLGHRDRCVLAHRLKSCKLQYGHTGTLCLQDGCANLHARQQFQELELKNRDTVLFLYFTYSVLFRFDKTTMSLINPLISVVHMTTLGNN